MEDDFILANTNIASSLIPGTGKFASPVVMLAAIDPAQYSILPNRSGARNADEAVRPATLARASDISDRIKPGAASEPRYLLPDGDETQKNRGAVSVMPLGVPAGSNLGMKSEELIRIIIEQNTIPVIAAGPGCPVCGV